MVKRVIATTWHARLLNRVLYCVLSACAVLCCVLCTGGDVFLLESVFSNDVWGFMCEPVSEDNEKAVCSAMVTVRDTHTYIRPHPHTHTHTNTCTYTPVLGPFSFAGHAHRLHSA